MAAAEFLNELSVLRAELGQLHELRNYRRLVIARRVADIADIATKLDEIWRENSSEVARMLSDNSAPHHIDLESVRQQLLRSDLEKKAKWAVNRVSLLGGNSNADPAMNIEDLVLDWFRFRLAAIKRSYELDVKESGHVQRRARKAMAAAMASMYLALYSMEDGPHKMQVAALSRASMASSGV